ncbi:MAG: ChaN family lipoprotein, partial [Proteobacteria bacterium]|nr:ChaN family lipoprotein [Pseudomonadota bacterium]
FSFPSWVIGSDEAMPTHNISMRFDLQNHQLIATSRIELPAGMSINLSLGHLYISQTRINGQEVETEEQETKNLPFSAADQDREIIITYSQVFKPGSASYDLISDAGITLTGNWYPIADHEMLFKLTVQVPKDFEAISEAEDIASFMIDGSKQVTFRFPHPLYAINFVAGPYVKTKETFGDNKTLVAYFFAEDQQLAAGYLQKARQYLERYEKLLGPYPYSRFSIVENRLNTGFAMPTYTLLGQAVVRLPFIVNTSLGHEVLHSWFGNGVRMDPRQGNWVEGLTTYLADHSFEADKERGSIYRKGQLIKYNSFVRPDMDLTLANFSNVDHRQSGSRPARAVGYLKSSMLFHMLREKVGQDAFINSLRDFYNHKKYKPAGWSDIKERFESVSDKDLTAFFDQWLDRTDIPALGVRKIKVSEKEGTPFLSFDLIQHNKEPYDLDVLIRIVTQEETILKKFFVFEKSSTFELSLPAVPYMLIIDPGYDLMRTLVSDELPPTWSHFLGAQDKVIIVPSEEMRNVYEPLLAELAPDVRILAADEVTDTDMSGSSLLFLAAGENRLSNSLFAEPAHPAEGFTLDIRKNPLNQDQVAILVSAADKEQVAGVAARLKHYGKYSYLHFVDGRITIKRITESDTGQQYDLVSLPQGIDTSRSRSFQNIMAKLANYQLIYVGESHTNYEDHKLQLEIIRDLYKRDPNLAIGMEMFTRSMQPVIDRYLNNEIDEKTFLKESHYFKTWRFDYRLYRDIINFAKFNNLPLVALNLEKNIVNQVFKNGGTTTLSEEDKELLPVARDLAMKGYRERIETAYLMHGGQGQTGDFSGFLQAQALWDETMAETIVDYLTEHPDKRMVVIVGRGHVSKETAIPPRVARRLPVSQAVVVNSIGSQTERQTADFIFYSAHAGLPPFPLLGVMLKDLEDEPGAMVIAVRPKGGANQAGIREKDIILAIDNEPIDTVEDVKITMLYKEESETVSLKIRRKQFLFGEKTLEIEVGIVRQSNKEH